MLPASDTRWHGSGSVTQIFLRVNRLAEAPDLEVQLDLIGIRISHFGNLLSLCDGLPFFDQNGLIMRVRRQIRSIVLDDHQLPISA